MFRADGDRARGFKTVLVSEADHPFWEFWWPPGHIIGWGETFVHEIHHMLRAIKDGTDIAPYGATFEDGYRAAEEAAMRLSARAPTVSGRRSPTAKRRQACGVSLVGAWGDTPRRLASSGRPFSAVT